MFDPETFAYVFKPVQVVEMYNEDEKREVFVECSWPDLMFQISKVFFI